MREYTNLFQEYGYNEQMIQKRLDNIWYEIFEGPNKVYFENDEGLGYVVDTGNNDVRTEGMSYAMLLALQYDQKVYFDKLWGWTKKYMYMDSGENAHYFAWSVSTSGQKYSYGPAPDGEEFFAIDLIFASNRWGDGKGIYNYLHEAQELLKYCIHKSNPMWDPDTKLIKFVPNCDFTDPSYHVPHFYDYFAKFAYEEDREFWKGAAKASRAYLLSVFHPETGLNPEYSLYDGSPQYHSEHPHFYSDAYRTALNVAVDMEWNESIPLLQERLKTLQTFFIDENHLGYHYELTIEGEPTEKEILHPVGLLATLAAASLANKETPHAKTFVQRFWETALCTGERRYYDNFLYAFSFLALSGRYQAFERKGDE